MVVGTFYSRLNFGFLLYNEWHCRILKYVMTFTIKQNRLPKTCFDQTCCRAWSFFGDENKSDSWKSTVSASLTFIWGVDAHIILCVTLAPWCILQSHSLFLPPSDLTFLLHFTWPSSHSLILPLSAAFFRGHHRSSASIPSYFQHPPLSHQHSGCLPSLHPGVFSLSSWLEAPYLILILCLSNFVSNCPMMYSFLNLSIRGGRIDRINTKAGTGIRSILAW